MPKLFMARQNDHSFARWTQSIYDATPPSKHMVIYPGVTHDANVFAAQSNALQRLSAFLLANASPA